MKHRLEIEADLITRLKKINRLLRAATSAGERSAAEAAMRRVGARLDDVRKHKSADDAASARADKAEGRKPKGRTELFAVKLSDPFNRGLMIAIARHYGLHPYAIRGAAKKNALRIAIKGDRAHFCDVVLPHYRTLEALVSIRLQAAFQALIRERLAGNAALAHDPHESVEDRWKR